MTLSSVVRTPIVGLIAVASLTMPATVFGQVDAQRCEGTVTDDQGQPLAGVTISFLDLETGREAQPVKTNKKGRYAHNVLRALTSPGYEVRATLDGHKIVKIMAHTYHSDGGKATDDSYLVGFDQKGLHKVAVPAQARSDVTSKGRCTVDFIMATDDSFNEAFRRLDQERIAKDGGEAPAAGSGAEAPGMPPQGEVPAEPAQTAKALDVGIAHISNRDWQGAIEPLRQAVAEDPNDPVAHRWLGGALLNTEDLAGAETELKQALAQDPNIVGLNFDMGLLYVKKGRLMQAIPHFEKEHELVPDSTAVHQNLGKLYADTQQWDKAVQIYEQAITVSPDNVENYGALAEAYKQMGNTEKELETYRRMGESDPSGMAFYNLGNMMFNKSEMKQAAEAYQKAVEVAPDNAMAHYQLGMTYVNLAKFKEAVIELETFVKLRPQDPRAAEAKSLAADLRKMGG